MPARVMAWPSRVTVLGRHTSTPTRSRARASRGALAVMVAWPDLRRPGPRASPGDQATRAGRSGPAVVGWALARATAPGPLLLALSEGHGGAQAPSPKGVFS